MTLAQVAKYAGLTRRAVLYAVHKGTLKAEKRVTFTGTVWLTTRQNVDRWIANEQAHRRGPKPI